MPEVRHTPVNLPTGPVRPSTDPASTLPPVRTEALDQREHVCRTAVAGDLSASQRFRERPDTHAVSAVVVVENRCSISAVHRDHATSIGNATTWQSTVTAHRYQPHGQQPTMNKRDQSAQDLRDTLLSELLTAQRPLTTAQLRRRLNDRGTAEVVLETIYRNLCVLRDREQIRNAGRAGRHTLWQAGSVPRPGDAPTPTTPLAAGGPVGPKKNAGEPVQAQRPNNPRQREATMPSSLNPEVRNLIDAANNGDTDGFLATFIPYQGVVDDWGRKFHGPEGIRRWSDAEFIGKRVTLKVIHFYSTDDAQVVVIAEVGGDGFNGPSTFTFRIANSKVTEMHITA